MEDFNKRMNASIDLLAEIGETVHVATLKEAMKRLNTPNSVDADSKPGGLGKGVVCVETGKEYESQRQACVDLGVTPAALCHHLKGRTGYKTVRGYTFTPVTPINGDTQ